MIEERCFEHIGYPNWDLSSSSPCTPRAPTPGKARSPTGTVGHLPGCVERSADLRLPWSEGFYAAQRWWSGAGSNRRPSAFQVKRSGRCADLRIPRSLSAGNTQGGICSVSLAGPGRSVTEAGAGRNGRCAGFCGCAAAAGGQQGQAHEVCLALGVDAAGALGRVKLPVGVDLALEPCFQAGPAGRGRSGPVGGVPTARARRYGRAG
jgi:hypothetical protein